MKFWEFRQIQPKQSSNVYVFVCEDDFLIGESRVVWQRISGMPAGEWVSKKYSAKEFEEIPSSRLIDDALTRSLFTENRLIIVTDAARLTKARIEVLGRVQSLPEASLRIVLVTDTRKPVESWPKIFPVIEIDSLRPADVARWLMDRYKLTPQIARYLTDNVGTDLYQLHNEVEKLQTYTGNARPIEMRDVDVLILRSEQFAAFDLDDAVLAGDYKKAVQVVGAMLDEGVDRPGMAPAFYREIASREKKRERDRSHRSDTRMESGGFCRLMQEVRVETTRGRVPAITQCRSRLEDLDAQSRGLL